MALKKLIVDPKTGVKAEFIEMIGINYNKRKELSELVVGVWIDQEAYEADLDPVSTIFKVIPSGAAPELAAGAYAFTMGFMKTIPELVGAVEI